MPRQQTRSEYLKEEIQRLEGAIAYLESAGIEIYNNRSPCVFEETEETRVRRRRENYPPEIYQMSGEDFLVSFKQALKLYKKELAELEK